MPEIGGILDDITVLDVSQGIPGSYATKLLAAMGARVIKVEPSSGDTARAAGPFFQDRPHPEGSGTFLYLNTGKESVTINLETPSGAALFKRLVPTASVLVESFPPGSMATWGLGYEDLSSSDPSLIYCSITDFGQTGPYRDYKGAEIVAEATGALLQVMGVPAREPLKMGGNPALMTAGVSAFSAIMTALHQRDDTGLGQYIDVSIMETVLVSGIHATIHGQFAEHDPGRRANTLAKAQDGWVQLGIQQATWKPFCEMIGRTDLIDDPRFSDQLARRDNAAALNEIVDDWLSRQSKEDVYHQLQAIRSIAGYVADVSDLFASRQYQERGFFQAVEHPVTGPVSYAGPPFRVGDQPWLQPPAPLLGQHNDAVLHKELGVPLEELARLREAGAI